MNIFKRLADYVPEKRHILYLTAISEIVAALITSCSLYVVYSFLTALIQTHDLAQSSHLALVCIASLVVGGLFYFVGGIFSHDFAFRLETNLKKKGLEGLSNASFSFFDQTDSGTVRRIIDDNTGHSHMLVAHALPDFSFAITQLIVLLVLGFFISLPCGLAIIALFIYALIGMWMMMGNTDFQKQYLTSMEVMNGEAVGYVRGLQVVKVFNADISSFSKLYNLIKSYSKLAHDYTLTCRLWWTLFLTGFFGTPAIAATLGFYLSQTSPEPKVILIQVLMIALLSNALFNCVSRCMYVGSYITEASNCIDKIEGIYNQMLAEKISHGEATDFDNFNIEFKNVNFAYGEHEVLKNFNLKLEEGKTYALVGPSGSGKSTTAHLISGFYKVNDGEILIGNRNIVEYSERAINDHIALVFQQTQLFPESIYDNVLIGNPDATKEQVFDALKRAECMPIIERLPQGVDSIVGSKGVYLSGGEMQRIAIARALLKDADIIIFDEASAATDPQCEYEILKAFKELIAHKTVIIIAHRLSTIKGVDEILVMKDGEVIERGSNSELMAKETTYKHLQELYAQAHDWRL